MTNASNVALGAVLNRYFKKHKILLKRTTQQTKKNLKKNLRNYIYGRSNLETHTDNQPLTFAISTRNSNAKVKSIYRRKFVNQVQISTY